MGQLPSVHPQLGTWPATQACALTWNQTGSLLVHRSACTSLNLTSQGSSSFKMIQHQCLSVHASRDFYITILLLVFMLSNWSLNSLHTGPGLHVTLYFRESETKLCIL